VTAPAGAPASALAPGEDGPPWHTLRADQVLQAEEVDGQHGLSSAEAASRAERFGPNMFDTGKAEPRWRVMSEIQKAVRRRTAPGQKETR
jgi:Cation transporter/ATPase, N-terminus